MMRWGKAVVVVLAVVAVVGCKPRRPSGILSAQEMEDIMVDYHLAQGMADHSDLPRQEARYRYILAALQKHRVTEAEFDTSLVYYSANAEQMTDIYIKVLERVRAHAQRQGVDATVGQNRFAHLTDQGDSANVWIGSEIATLLPDRRHNIMQFALPVDTSFHAGDSFIWHMATEMVNQGVMRDVQAQLVLTYANDSVVGVSQTLYGNKAHDISYEPGRGLDTIPVRSIYGFVFLPLATQENTSLQVVLLRDLSFIRIRRVVEEPVPSDSIASDTLATHTASDSLSQALRNDSLAESVQAVDSISSLAPSTRLTPKEMRDKEPHERKINVVKEQPYTRRGTRGKNQRRRMQ